MKGYFIYGLLFFIYAGCLKRYRSDIPVVTFKKANPNDVSINNIIEVVSGENKVLSLEYDFESNRRDITGMTLTKIVQNQLQIRDGKKFSVQMAVTWPNVPVQDKPQTGSIRILLSYVAIGGPRLANQDDTVQFALQLKDSRGNLSDTAFSNNIIIRRLRVNS